MSAPLDRRLASGLVTLRVGDSRPALYLFPGTGGEARELAPLAEHLAEGPAVVGVEVYGEGGSVQAMADRAFAAIRAVQAHGPYQLVGYSFGGLAALEVAVRILSAGEDVGLLALVDTVTSDRFWPAPLFLMAQVRRAGVQLRALKGLSPAAAGRMFAHRIGRLAGKLGARLFPAAKATPTAATRNVRAATDAAMAAYRPAPYAGPVVLLRSAGRTDFGCDPAALWRPLIPDLKVHEVTGDHLSVVRESSALDQVAAVLDRRLAEGRRPPGHRVLLTTTMSWSPTNRLALALSEAGFSVQAMCPGAHSLRRLDFIDRVHPYRALARDAGLRSAIQAARPDLILPCDDRATRQLWRLYEGDCEDAPLRALIARSLGDPVRADQIRSRSTIMDLARELGVRRPSTVAVPDAATAKAWLETRKGPAVLKIDGSWGGAGVALVDAAPQAVRAFRRLTAPPSLVRTTKRLLLNHDPNLLPPFLAQRRAQASIQDYVDGRPANAAVACLAGEVLAAVYVEVVRSNGAMGPSTVVRVVDHPEMAQAVTRMVRALGLSGLCGFDFILQAETGAAYLIELNPRATPTCHLRPADGRDLLSALYAAQTGGRAPPPKPAAAADLVALFPQELMRDPASEFLHTGRHDVPWQSPLLVKLGLAQAARRQRALSQTLRWLHAGLK